MNEYHKIKTLWKRESEKPCNMIVGEYALPEFELLKDLKWVATEKIDGTNVRVMWDGNKVKFGGKTDNAQMPVYLLDKLTELFGGEANEQVFEQTFEGGDVCLYGEGFGEKIQKGGGNYGKVNFILFDVKIGDFWLERKDIEDIAEKLGIEVVPIIFEGTLQELSDFVKDGFDSLWGSFKAEGIVAKPEVELKNRRGDRIITKLKYKDFIKLN
jgi:ATP-dependent RNA circularization protein (DNA/RNA ligase family)